MAGFSDNFNRADGVVANGWTQGYNSLPVITGNALAASSGNVGAIVRDLGTAGTLTATFKTVVAGTSNSAFIIFRRVSETAFLWAGVTGLNDYITSLASWPAVAAGTVMTVEYTTTTIVVKGNGVILASINNTTNATATAAGVGVGSTGTIDDFSYIPVGGTAPGALSGAHVATDTDHVETHNAIDTALASRLVYRGAFSSTATYAINDVVTYNSSSYVAKVAIAPPATYSAAVLADSPSAYWRLGEASGTTAADSSGGTGTATFSAAPTWGATSLVGGTNTAASLNGITSATASVPNEVYNAVSVEAWFKTTSSSAQQGIINRDNNGNAGSPARHWQLNMDSGKIEATVFYPNGTTLAQAFSPLTYNDGNAHHAVFTYDGINIRLYVDGAQVAITSLTGGLSDTDLQPVVIGRAPNGGYFTGTLDELALYKNVLSATRVAAHYTAGSGGAFNAANWDVLAAQGATGATGASGSGSGGATKVVAVAESGDSLTNWSSSSGTWASNGGYISETATASGTSSIYRLRYNTALGSTLSAVSFKIRIPSAGQANANLYAGMVFSSNPAANGGGQVRLQRTSGVWQIEWEIESVTAIGTANVTYTPDTWATLRIDRNGTTYTATFNGTVAGTFGINASVDTSWLHLYSNSTLCDFDDIYCNYLKIDVP